MKKLLTSAVLLGLVIAMPHAVAASEQGEMKKAEKPVSCKKQAVNAGLKDKKEIRAFIKECKAGKGTNKAR
jgi:hypothetical protein